MADRIEGLSIGLDLDALALDRGLTGLKDRLKTVNSEMKANLSAFDRADKSVEKYETRLNGLNRKLEVQKRVVVAAASEYEKMVAEYGKGSKEAEKANRELNNQVSSLNNLQRNIERTTDDLKELKKSQQQASSGWAKFNDAAKKTESTLTNIGEVGKNVGQTLTASLTVPLTGFALMAGKSALEFEAAQGKIQAQLGLTAKEAENLSEVAQDVWENGFGESIDEVSNALAKAEQNMGAFGWASKQELQEIGESALMLSKTFEADVNDTTKTANQLITQFGLSSKEAFDMLTWGFQNGLNYSDDFLDTVNEYSVQFATMGMSAEEMFSIFEQGAISGAFNMDKVGDAVKEFNIRIKDGSKTTSDAMGELSKGTQQVWKDFERGEKTGKEVMQAIIKELSSMDDQVKANQIAVGVFGTQWEDLESDAVYAMGNVSNELSGVEGATKKAGDALNDNLGVRAQKLWRNFLTDMQPVGEVLVDLAEDILPEVAKTIGYVTDAFTSLSPEGQKTTLLIGGLVTAVGPLVTILGFATTGVGSFMGVLGLLTGPVGITVGILAALGAGFVALDKAMDKPVIKSDIFAGEISEATQAAVGAYMDLDSDATAELNNLSITSQTITDKMADYMISKYAEMGDTILQNMKENHTKQLEEQRLLFEQSAVLTEEEEAKRLAKLKADQLAEEEAHNANQARIKEIWTIAAEEKRGITDAEAKEIAQIQNNMRLKAVEELSASKQEQETILRNLKQNKSIIEAETAANTVRKSAETRDKVIKEANQQYSQTVSSAESARDELGIISTAEAAKIIKEAERKKNESVANAQDTHSLVVTEAQKQAQDHVDEVNWETGGVLSGWDSMYNGVLDAVNWVRGLFGKEPLAKRGSVKENGRQRLKRQNAKFSAYADGTPSSGHPGGPAIVGEEGIELAHIPGQGVTILGTKGPEFLSNLPRGSSVLPNKQTERLLKSYGFPGYAEGIGDYFDLFLKGSSSVWDMVKGKFNLSDSVIPSWLNNHTGSPLTYIKDMATSWIKGLWDNWFGDMGNVTGGSGVQRWSGIATRALMMTGQFTKANLDRLLYQMQTESGGNPRAINLWDINAKRGIPSKGLMQVIDPTFRAYAHPGFNNNIYDPLSNILASIRYAVSRYGSLARAYRGVGYKSGGLINNQGLYELAEGGWPEWVIPTDPSRRTDAMKLLALAGKEIQGNKRPHQLPNISGNSTSDDSLLQAVLEQNRILMALLQSSKNIEKKPIISQYDIGRAAEKYDSQQSINHAIFTGRAAL